MLLAHGRTRPHLVPPPHFDSDFFSKKKRPRSHGRCEAPPDCLAGAKPFTASFAVRGERARSCGHALTLAQRTVGPLERDVEQRALSLCVASNVSSESPGAFVFLVSKPEKKKVE